MKFKHITLEIIKQGYSDWADNNFDEDLVYYVANACLNLQKEIGQTHFEYMNEIKKNLSDFQLCELSESN